ncbi:ABC transporter permease [Streptomyces sp. NPDC048664]|uniref:ABC transporter permease n=1 Tax=Streptomyces sp. NPDC048664 TaxID=3154505 RepID=UPI00341C6364
MSTPQPPMPQAAAPAWQQTPGSAYPTYTSPIPVTQAHLGHAIASEWTKIRSLRSTLWTLGVFVLLVFGLGLLLGLVFASHPESIRGSNPLGIGLFGLMLGSICVNTLGVLTTASEYGTGMIRTTMTACPSRTRVLAAKSIVFFLLTFAVTFVSATLVAFIDMGLLSGHGAKSPTGSDWFKGTVGISLYIALLGVLALVVGSILRHSAGAITLMIGLVLAPLVVAIFMVAESLDSIRKFLLEYSIPNQLSVFYSGSLTDTGPSGWDPLWIALGLVAAAFAGAWLLLEKRDV